MKETTQNTNERST